MIWTIALASTVVLGLAVPAGEACAAPPKPHSTMAVIQQWQVHYPLGGALLEDSAYEACRKVGITSLQSYVGWAQLEPEQGKVTYDCYDPVVNQIRKHDLKWLPFIITSPYVATPKWFREQKGVEYTCLEHGKSLPIQSLWNPNLRAGVRRFLEIFKAHYEPEVIEAFNIGVSGNWGESLMPVGGGFDLSDDVHTHGGWWCGDKYARADFRKWVQKKYLNIDALNAAWKTSYSSFDQVEPSVPAEAPSLRAAVDQADWYMQSMNDYSEFWVKTIRELYPDTPIYLCTGGEGQPRHGADLAAQAKLSAKYGAGVRITNQHDDALSNFSVTRMVSSAARLYGGYYTTEPAGDNTPAGIAGRVFDVVSGGAVGAYFKGLIERDGTTALYAQRFVENAQHMVSNVPQLPVAALMPNSSIVQDEGVLPQFLAQTTQLRDALDFEFIDERMICDGLLDRFSALVLLSGDTLESATLAKVREWIEAGGVLMAPSNCLPLKSVEGEPADWAPALPGGDAYRLVTTLKVNSAAAIKQATKPLGKGYVVTWPGVWNSYRTLLNSALHAEADQSPWNKQIAEPIDAQFDNILACRAGDEVFYYNNTDQTINKRAVDGNRIRVYPRSILKVQAPKPH